MNNIKWQIAGASLTISYLQDVDELLSTHNTKNTPIAVTGALMVATTQF
jgi:hypothetical protein